MSTRAEQLKTRGRAAQLLAAGVKPAKIATRLGRSLPWVSAVKRDSAELLASMEHDASAFAVLPADVPIRFLGALVAPRNDESIKRAARRHKIGIKLARRLAELAAELRICVT